MPYAVAFRLRVLEGPECFVKRRALPAASVGLRPSLSWYCGLGGVGGKKIEPIWPHLGMQQPSSGPAFPPRREAAWPPGAAHSRLRLVLPPPGCRLRLASSVAGPSYFPRVHHRYEVNKVLLRQRVHMVQD